MTDKKQKGVNLGTKRGSYGTDKKETSLINFRVPANKVDYLKPLVSQYIKSLLEQNSAPAITSKTTTDTSTPKPKTNPTKEPTLAELWKAANAKK